LPSSLFTALGEVVELRMNVTGDPSLDIHTSDGATLGRFKTFKILTSAA
jgi:hypothetical protein